MNAETENDPEPWKLEPLARRCDEARAALCRGEVAEALAAVAGVYFALCGSPMSWDDECRGAAIAGQLEALDAERRAESIWLLRGVCRRAAADGRDMMEVVRATLPIISGYAGVPLDEDAAASAIARQRYRMALMLPEVLVGPLDELAEIAQRSPESVLARAVFLLLAATLPEHPLIEQAFAQGVELPPPVPLVPPVDGGGEGVSEDAEEDETAPWERKPNWWRGGGE